MATRQDEFPLVARALRHRGGEMRRQLVGRREDSADKATMQGVVCDDRGKLRSLPLSGSSENVRKVQVHGHLQCLVYGHPR